MSGPKVVNVEAIRRRQQREALARLRAFHDLLAEWRRARERLGTLTPEATSEAEAIRRRLAALRQNADWTGLLSELSARERFFQNETRAANEEHLARVKRARERRRRTEIAAAGLARELRAAGIEASTDLDAVASKACRASDGQLERFENELQSAIAKLAERRHAEEATKSAGRMQQLAAQLTSEGDPQETIKQCLARTAPARADSDRLEHLLAEIEAWGSGEEVAPFLQKAQAINAEASEDRRAMLLDTLILELGTYRKRQREKEEAARLLRAALARLEPFESDEANVWRTKIEAALAIGSDGQELASSVQAWCEVEEKREEARLRRDAVLRALASLGYEVREGMSAAWAESGRIIVRKPSEPNYGVELAAPAAGPALQARVVAFDHPGRGAASVTRDREVETSWCSEFEDMKSSLASDGFAVYLQHASPVGAVALKVVPGDATRRPHPGLAQGQDKLREL